MASKHRSYSVPHSYYTAHVCYIPVCVLRRANTRAASPRPTCEHEHEFTADANTAIHATINAIVKDDPHRAIPHLDGTRIQFESFSRHVCSLHSWCNNTVLDIYADPNQFSADHRLIDTLRTAPSTDDRKKIRYATSLAVANYLLINRTSITAAFQSHPSPRPQSQIDDLFFAASAAIANVDNPVHTRAIRATVDHIDATIFPLVRALALSRPSLFPCPLSTRLVTLCNINDPVVPRPSS